MQKNSGYKTHPSACLPALRVAIWGSCGYWYLRERRGVGMTGRGSRQRGVSLCDVMSRVRRTGMPGHLQNTRNKQVWLMQQENAGAARPSCVRAGVQTLTKSLDQYFDGMCNQITFTLRDWKLLNKSLWPSWFTSLRNVSLCSFQDGAGSTPHGQNATSKDVSDPRIRRKQKTATVTKSVGDTQHEWDFFKFIFTGMWNIWERNLFEWEHPGTNTLQSRLNLSVFIFWASFSWRNQMDPQSSKGNISPPKRPPWSSAEHLAVFWYKAWNWLTVDCRCTHLQNGNWSLQISTKQKPWSTEMFLSNKVNLIF